MIDWKVINGSEQKKEAKPRVPNKRKRRQKKKKEKKTAHPSIKKG